MFKKLSGGALLMLSLIGTSAQAADKTQDNLVINQVTPTNGGLLIGFKTRPADCTTAYQGHHALLGTGLENFDSLYALVSVAEITGDPVTVHYIDNGSCGSKTQLLGISNIE